VLYSSGPLESRTSLGSMVCVAKESVFNPFPRKLIPTLGVCSRGLIKSEVLKASGPD
jgi:hypothetical protein